MEAFELTPRPIFKVETPARDYKYLAFLRKLCCVVCGSFWRVEAAHFGAHGMSSKASDYDALPLCRKCHRTGPKAYHSMAPWRFVSVHNLSVSRHQRECREGYARITGRAA
jgi:hypothetical protein